MCHVILALLFNSPPFRFLRACKSGRIDLAARRKHFTILLSKVIFHLLPGRNDCLSAYPRKHVTRQAREESRITARLPACFLCYPTKARSRADERQGHAELKHIPPTLSHRLPACLSTCLHACHVSSLPASLAACLLQSMLSNLLTCLTAYWPSCLLCFFLCQSPKNLPILQSHLQTQVTGWITNIIMTVMVTIQGTCLS